MASNQENSSSKIPNQRISGPTSTGNPTVGADTSAGSDTLRTCDEGGGSLRGYTPVAEKTPQTTESVTGRKAIKACDETKGQDTENGEGTIRSSTTMERHWASHSNQNATSPTRVITSNRAITKPQSQGIEADSTRSPSSEEAREEQQEGLTEEDTTTETTKI